MKETMGNGDRCAAPDFEAMYARLAEENRKLHLENERLKCELGNTQTRCQVLEGQLGIVQLIFGGKT